MKCKKESGEEEEGEEGEGDIPFLIKNGGNEKRKKRRFF
jgi:hypothetical protein